ncbi:F-box/kelch-repeat protein [Apostasia shenzhenica]|uniref:F-box/kelch-repeat protein n=1 Tax=Apostasia shenzhenica TaxID=1088818 RepID=A0A2I0AII9_9ASPA|nr:F-box/kelch-repeat protein [Apostasia shenzhenica]
MGDTCNSRGFTWLVKSCITDSCREVATSPATNHRRHHDYLPCFTTAAQSILSLPDDLLLDCFSRVPLPSLPSLSLVCRRFALLLDSPAFNDLRRSSGRLTRFLLALSVSNLGHLTLASLPLPLPPDHHPSWAPPFSLRADLVQGAFSQPRIAAIGRSIYIIGQGAALRYDSWTGAVSRCAPTLYPRKKFAVAAVGSMIYVAGGASRTSAVEEYDPETDVWRVVSEAPRRRYGCVGAAAGGVFYVIGGIRVGARPGEVDDEVARSAHACAGSLDAYHVRSKQWLRSRAAVPGGGCVVGACGAGPHVYVLASHAVEVSFWRWEARGRRGGDWIRLESPPAPAGKLRRGGAVRFSCAAVGDDRLVALVYSSAGCGGQRGVESAMLVYDITAGEWSRGPDLPPELRRAGCAFVEC